MEENKSLPIPVTIINGFLGAGKTTIILNILQHISKTYNIAYDNPDTESEIVDKEKPLNKNKYSVVWLKNEFGVNEVDSVLAEQSSISGVKEILNGCLCCTLVGKLSDAIKEIMETMPCDRILIETSGSAFPAPLVQEINRVKENKECDVTVDGVVCVIDAANFLGYVDKTYTARVQAAYTDLIIINKAEMVNDRQLDDVLDAVCDINPETPRIHSSKGFVHPDIIFGVDHRLLDASIGDGVSSASAGDVDIYHSEWVSCVNRHTLQETDASPEIMNYEQFEKLLDFLNNNHDCIRAKGIVLIKNMPWNVVSSNLSPSLLAELDQSSNDSSKQEKDTNTNVTAVVLLNWAFGKQNIMVLNYSHNQQLHGTLPTQSLVPSSVFIQNSKISDMENDIEGTISNENILCVSRLTFIGVSMQHSTFNHYLTNHLPVNAKYNDISSENTNCQAHACGGCTEHTSNSNEVKKNNKTSLFTEVNGDKWLEGYISGKYKNMVATYINENHVHLE